MDQNRGNRRDLLWKDLTVSNFSQFTALGLSGQEFVRLYTELGQRMKTDRFVEFPDVSTMSSEVIPVLEVLRASL